MSPGAWWSPPGELPGGGQKGMVWVWGGVLSSALLSDLDLWDGQSQALSLSPTTIVTVVRLKSHRFLSRGSENLTQTHGASVSPFLKKG